MENGRSDLVKVLVCLLVCAAILGAVLIATDAYRSKEPYAQTVTVKGYAERVVKSDTASWYCDVGCNGKTIAEAYAEIEKSVITVVEKIKSYGFVGGSIEVCPVQYNPILEKTESGAETNHVDYYTASRRIKLTNDDIDKVTIVASEIVSLAKVGIYIESSKPEYYLKDLEKFKIELLRDATKIAKARAEEIVKAGGMSLGLLRDADQGVFQVVAVNSTDVSDYGEYDTSAIVKKVTLVVTTDWGIR